MTKLSLNPSMDRDDIAISPVGIPLITGPGALTSAVILSGKTPGISSYGTLLLAIIIVLTFVYFIFRGGDTVAKKIGQSGMRAIQRIMGIVLMVIAIQFIINGSETVFSRIF